MNLILRILYLNRVGNIIIYITDFVDETRNDISVKYKQWVVNLSKKYSISMSDVPS